MDEDKLDPARVDAIADPAPKRKRRKKSPYRVPEQSEVEASKRQLAKRPLSPGVMLEPAAEGHKYESPHNDPAAWETQLCAAFGTRSWMAMQTFILHLEGLVQQTYDFEAGQWQPNERELNAMLAIVNGVQPKNEMQAMLAAQMCAIHFLQMKIASYSLNLPASAIDARTIASSSMLARTFVQQADALKRQQSKRRTTKQKIEVHHHTHQHVHLEGGGSKTEGQGHELIGHAGSTALPRADAAGVVVPMPRQQGKDALPEARGSKRIRGSEG